MNNHVDIINCGNMFDKTAQSWGLASSFASRRNDGADSVRHVFLQGL